MTKDQTRARIQQLKNWIVGGSVAGFVVLTGLITNHTFGITQAIGQSLSAGASQSDDSSGFFNQSGSGSNVNPSNGSSPFTGSGGS